MKQAFWVVVLLTNSLNTKTSIINNCIVIRSVNANLNDDHREVAKHITSHGSVYSRADISAILYMGVDLHERDAARG